MVFVVIKVAVWVVIFISLINCGLEMLSASSTIQNIIGFLIIVAIIVVSLETECLTKLKIKKKNEK